MSSLADLFGKDCVLSGPDGSDKSVSSVSGEGKVLGLYFSAHWCPPCRTFTPQLATWYKKIKQGPDGANFDIVFISSDKDEHGFDEYFSSMPWLALPFDLRVKKGELSKKFKVSGIPTLVLLDGQTAKAITNDGRSVVMDDEDGKGFPWAPRKFEDIISGELVNRSGEKKQWSDVNEDVIGLYFSAHWCGPCRAFTPQLTKSYKKLKDEEKSYEIIFVTSDRDESSMTEYLSEMPWWAVPYGDKRCKALSRSFDISGIPSLIILKKSGEIITTQGRTAIAADPEGQDFPWKVKPLNLLSGNTASDVNDSPCLIWFIDGTRRAIDTLTSIAEDYVNEVKSGSKEELFFFYSDLNLSGNSDEIDDDSVGKSLKTFAGITEDVEMLVLINIPDQKVYIREGEVTTTAIDDVLSEFNAGKLAMKPLRS